MRTAIAAREPAEDFADHACRWAAEQLRAGRVDVVLRAASEFLFAAMDAAGIDKDRIRAAAETALFAGLAAEPEL